MFPDPRFTITKAMSIHVLCKRGNETVFVYCEPTDTVAQLGAKLLKMLEAEDRPIKFFGHPDKQHLLDASTLTDYKVDHGDTVYWVEKVEGQEDWEEINAQDLNALDTSRS
jgi:hypothetical protein